MIEPPNSVVLLAGHQEFTTPSTPRIQGLTALGEFRLETDRHVSIRDVYSREYDVLLVEPGLCTVTYPSQV